MEWLKVKLNNIWRLVKAKVRWFLLVTGMITIAYASSLGGPVLGSPLVEMSPDATANLDTLSADLQKLGVSKGSADGIQEYFKGEKKYITLNEKNDWTGAVNKAMQDLKVTEIKNVQGKEDLVNKLNWLINEAGKI